ncbi:MAG: glycosyltransferase family 2 protein [Candidatus Daviesbacteria bacterium]|nr:glycosyltransferase family 2 protein [Candidatus Daviesbacteria bacterium]
MIVNFNTEKLILDCLESIYKNKPKVSFEIWVVDNCSTDQSVSLIKKHFPNVHLIESDKNLGFAGGNNLALKKASAKNYLLLNSDTLVKSNSLDNLVDFASSSDYGICSCKLVYKNGAFQPNAGELPTFFPMFFWISGLDDILEKVLFIKSYQARDKNYYFDKATVGWVSGSVMLVKDEVIKKIGLLDEAIFMYGEDVEYCFRANKAGFITGWTNSAEIIHIGGGSSTSPKYNQWFGEFKGLIYIYNKLFGTLAMYFIKFMLYSFILVRTLIFLLLGKVSYSKTYAKIFINL